MIKLRPGRAVWKTSLLRRDTDRACSAILGGFSELIINVLFDDVFIPVIIADTAKFVKGKKQRFICHILLKVKLSPLPERKR